MLPKLDLMLADFNIQRSITATGMMLSHDNFSILINTTTEEIQIMGNYIWEMLAVLDLDYFLLEVIFVAISIILGKVYEAGKDYTDEDQTYLN